MSPATQARLAMVEDSDEDFAAYRRVFGREPGDALLERWSSGEDALEALRARDLSALSVLTVDLHLPGIDGCAVIEEVRALPGGEIPTICALSGSEAARDRQRALNAGADAYIIKPSDLAGLRELPGQLRAIAEAVAASR